MVDDLMAEEMKDPEFAEAFRIVSSRLDFEIKLAKARMEGSKGKK
jgi:hypothetical protein